MASGMSNSGAALVVFPSAKNPSKPGVIPCKPAEVFAVIFNESSTGTTENVMRSPRRNRSIQPPSNAICPTSVAGIFNAFLTPGICRICLMFTVNDNCGDGLFSRTFTGVAVA